MKFQKDLNRRYFPRQVLAVLALALSARMAAADPFPALTNPADIFGVAHVDGKYYLTRQDFLEEGAGQVAATGSKVIKLYLTPRRYPWNSQWPANVRSLAQMAQTPYFHSVLAMPFDTYILTAYALGRSDHYWTGGVTAAEQADETRQFHDLTRYLLTAFRGSGKTFILQHWEGDWALRSGSPKAYDPNFIPSDTTVEGMIQWLNARQAGIVQARNEVGPTDVHVYGATEANRVEDSMAGKPGVANSVLPHTTVDLASYSCYDFLDTSERLAQAVDYIAAHLPPTAVFGQNAHSVYLGEFGYPENGQEGIAGVNRRLDNAEAVVKSKGLPWAAFWEVYCNEPVDSSLPLPLNGKQNDANLRGFWMVKPDGSPSQAWHRYRRLFALAEATQATTGALKGGLTQVFADEFARADGTNLGTAWTEAAHYGIVNRSLRQHHLHFEIPEGRDIPWGSATLDLKDPAILGRGLQPGDYFEVTLRRLSAEGSLGVELFDSDQLRVGGDLTPGASPLKAWNGITWVPISLDDHGQPIAFDWNQTHVLGVRFDSADGYRTTFSYYVDGQYAGAWLINTGNKTLEKIGVYAQSKTPQAVVEFDALKVYARSR